MSYTNSEIIKRFAEGKTKRRSCNIFIDGDTLYSFGHHFPMLMRREFGFLLNTDKYSCTTSSHQSLCRQYANVEVPFSILKKAGIPYTDFSLIHKSDIAFDRPPKWHKSLMARYTIGDIGYRYRTITHSEYKLLPKEMRSGWTKSERRSSQSALILHYQNQHYLFIEDGGRYYQHTRYLYQLSHKVTTVEEAIGTLLPDAVRGRNYQRQGEWHFVKEDAPATLFWERGNAKAMYKQMARNFCLPNHNGSDSHMATRGCAINNQIFVSGRIHHPDHECLTLSKYNNPEIFRAYKNLATASYTTTV